MKFFLASVFVLGGAIQGVTPFQQRGLTAAPRRPYYSKALHVAQDVQETIEAGQEPAGTVVGCNIPDCKVLRVGWGGEREPRRRPDGRPRIAEMRGRR